MDGLGEVISGGDSRAIRLWRKLALGAALLVALVGPAQAARADEPPPIRHVWVIVLENSSYNKVAGNSPFNTPNYSPYLANTLTKQGSLLTQYWGTAHNSLSNYVAMVSGQAPTPGTQSDALFCTGNEDIPDVAPVDPHGQIVGQGCTYPTKVKTLFDQLSAAGVTWKEYMQDLRESTFRDNPGCPSKDDGSYPEDQYVRKHDPLQWFHGLFDDQAACLAHDVPLWDLAKDLRSVETTPNFNFISPGLLDDGHEGGFPSTADSWLRQFVPMIMASPAYRQDGMILVTFDESETVVGVPLGPEDDQACCNEIPGPNSPSPGVNGPGGGHTGALVLSPFVKPGSKVDPVDNPTHTGTGFYNHYTFLRSMEDLFGINSGGDDGQGHLGFAGTYLDYPGPGVMGNEIYNGHDGTPASPAPTPSPADPTGPRQRDRSVTWQHPRPQGDDLQGISCPTEDSCFAVGEAGAMQASVDGGDTFSQQDSGTTATLRAISCSGAASCVAVGDDGTAIRTTDAGGHWASHSTGTALALHGVSCPTDNTCVAVGDDGVIVRSGDGGASWSSQNSGTTEPLYAVSCPTEDACHAVGQTGTIVATTDGSTWASQAPRTDERLRAVSCADENSCVAAGDRNAVTRTSNGGSTWNDTTVRDYHRGVDCTSPTDCVLAGKEMGNIFEPQAVLQTTTDGGASWTRHSSHTNNHLFAISCPTPTKCLAVGLRGQIVRSVDAGGNWSSRSPGTDDDLSRVICNGLHCRPESLSSVQGGDCPAPDTCFMVGTSRTVMATTNGGAGWTTQTSGIPPNTYSSVTNPPVPPPSLNSIDCASTAKCVAVGDVGSVVSTSDGGGTWSDQNSGTASELLGVTCLTANVCLAVGAQGTIIKTNNGGTSWVKLNPGVDDVLSDVTCADAFSCVAVGNFGTVLTTDDGGAIWDRRSSGTTNYLDGVSCPDTTHCLAVGSGGTVLASGDLGQSWSPQSSGVGDDLMSVNCSSADDCLASGSSGVAISTADGGGSWITHGTGTDRTLRAASCPSTNRCFVGGDAGAIQRVCPTAGTCISIDDVTVTEGDTGTVAATFTVSLSSASDDTVTVDYQTNDGTAMAPGDYAAQGNTLTFDPGETTQTITVLVNGDTAGEGDETFTVDLDNPQNAALDDGQGTGTILDDDARISVSDESVVEGDTGTVDANFTVTVKDATAGQTVTVDYETNDGTATAPDDYTAQGPDPLTFNPGETEQTVTVPVNGDTVGEGSETFTLDLSNASGAELAKDSGTGTIIDDDPKVSIDDQTVPEGNSGTTDATFTVSLSDQSSQTVTVDYHTQDGTARSPADFTAQGPETLTFNPGETAQTVTVPIEGDTLDEDDEGFMVVLSSVENGAIADQEGDGQITDDDLPPTISIDDHSQGEGDSGQASAAFEVTLSAPSGKDVSVDYATHDGTAHEPGDYTARSGTLVFEPDEGETEQTVMVPIIGDTANEADETYTVDLSGAANASLAKAQGAGTILNDDAAVASPGPPAPAPPTTPSVMRDCTTQVVGTSGDDVLTGTSESDFFLGLLGKDRLLGLDGSDCLIGGPGDDTLAGGGNGDLLRGGDGRDLVSGGTGNDVISGGRGLDRLSGGSGDDRIRSFDLGRDQVRCGPGEDDAVVNPEDDVSPSCEHVGRHG